LNHHCQSVAEIYLTVRVSRFAVLINIITFVVIVNPFS
jgi:hypothetical protein